MSTLVNRDWYIANTDGKPLKVRCLSQNYVLGTARVVSSNGEFGEVAATALRHTAKEILARNLRNESVCALCGRAGILEPLPCSGGAAGDPVIACVWCTTQVHQPICEAGCND